jgi:hypothetical protein
MKVYIALAFAASALATPMPQAGAPSGCVATSDEKFNIKTVDQSTSKRDLQRRQLDGTLTISLKDGVLKDQAGRQGYIASNYQYVDPLTRLPKNPSLTIKRFQFDPEPQPNSKQNQGFSLCSNNTLALSGGIPRPFGDTTFWQCLSGDFYNLYSDSQGMQCIKIYIEAVMAASSGSASGSQAPASQTPAVSQIPDGQPQATTAASKLSSAPAISQLSDGQPQATTPAASPPAPKPSGPAVSQLSDGQPQATTPAASPPAAAPSGPAVSQLSDGQPQATTPAASLPAPKPSGPVVSQIVDGQPQATTPAGNLTGTKPSTSAPLQYTGAAAASNVNMGAFAAGLFGLFALL